MLSLLIQTQLRPLPQLIVWSAWQIQTLLGLSLQLPSLLGLPLQLPKPLSQAAPLEHLTSSQSLWPHAGPTSHVVQPRSVLQQQ